MEDSVFVIFIAFGCLWILTGAASLILFLKSNGQGIRFGKEGLVVTIPIIIPIIAALIFSAVYH